MANDKRLKVMILALAALMLAGLACNMPGAGADPTASAPPVPVSSEAVESLEEEVRSAATQASQGENVTLVITEEQLTSLVAFELEDQTDPALNNPQVRLTDGQIELYGDVEQNGLELPLKLVLTVSVNEQGEPEYEVLSANLGPVSLPDSILDSLTRQIDTSLASLTSRTEDMVVEDITIGQGEMTITGRRRS